MADIKVSIAGEFYDLTCGEGEEERLKTLAVYIDSCARSLLEASPSFFENREQLMVVVSFLLADELEDLKDSYEEREKQSNVLHLEHEEQMRHFTQMTSKYETRIAALLSRLEKVMEMLAFSEKNE